ncbi:MAG: hypothetical protein NXI30_04765 [bacterium]|nr:hypothetical protein [bacterium]
MASSGPLARLVPPALRPVALFTLGYLLAATCAAVWLRNTEFVFYIAVMVALIAIVLVVQARVGLSAGLIWSLSIWGAMHMAGGLVPVPGGWPTDGGQQVLYSLWILPGAEGSARGWLKYDQLTHAYGFAVATWLCWQGLCGAVAPATGTSDSEPRPPLRPTPGLLILVAIAGMGLGALNEVVEFTATRFMDTNVGGYENTGWDLVYNALGATGAALAIGWRASVPRA